MIESIIIKLTLKMSITPEQFNKIIKDAIKEELTPFREEVREKIDTVITAVDNITKKFEDHNSEHIANIGAHDRFDKEINLLKNQNALKIRLAK